MMKDVYVPSYFGKLGFNVPSHMRITRAKPSRASLARMGVFVAHPSILRVLDDPEKCEELRVEVESDWFRTGAAEVRIVLSDKDSAAAIEESFSYVALMLSRLQELKRRGYRSTKRGEL
jgi:hypothetical protein